MSDVRAVLGIDAAWTLAQPSGVALAAETATGWRLVAVASSYQQFQALAEGRQSTDCASTGSAPDAISLLHCARVLCGRPINLAAVDMPLAHSPIIARRASDNAVSRVYGARKCGTHSPNAIRPGRISDDLRRRFEEAGYPPCTEAIQSPGLIEVYPHPALVELASAAERLRYKAAKGRSYWPSLNPDERRKKIFATWAQIVLLLNAQLAGVSAALPPPHCTDRGRILKAYEDKLDAVVCAWIAISALERRAVPYGDQDSAIWIPLVKANLDPSAR